MTRAVSSRPLLACCLVAALGFATLSAVRADEAVPPKRLELPHLAQRLNKDAPITIVAFGSSSTEGVGASSPAHAYPAQLEADLDKMVPKDEQVTVVNRGIGGQDADDMLARLDRDVIAVKPDLVIWQTGTNDPLRKLPLDRFEAETREGITRMHDAGIDVVLMEPQDCRMMRTTAGSMGYRDAVRRIGAEMGVPVVRRFDLIDRWLADGKVTEAQLMAPDGLHMADLGYEKLAAEVAREVLAEAGRKATMLANMAR